MPPAEAAQSKSTLSAANAQRAGGVVAAGLGAAQGREGFPIRAALTSHYGSIDVAVLGK